MLRVLIASVVSILPAIPSCAPAEQQVVLRARELEQRGDRPQAGKVLRDLLKSLEGQDSSGGRRCLAVVLNNLGSIEQDVGNYRLAAGLYRRSLSLEDGFGGDTSSTLDNLGSLYFETGQYRKAENARKKALDIRIAGVGPNDPGVARILQNLAAQKHAQGFSEEALNLYRRAFSIWEQSGMEQTPEAATALNGVGLAYAKSGDLKMALQFVRRAVAIWERSLLAASQASAAKAEGNIAVLLQMSNQRSEAKAYWLAAIGRAEDVSGRDSVVTRHILTGYLKFLEETGQIAEAKAVRQRVQSWDEIHGSPSRRADLVDITELRRR